MNAIIQIKNLTKGFGQGTLRVEALRGIDLEIAEGEFTAIVGPSGSGKTTLLNCIGALDRPDSGSIVIDGQRIERLSKKERSRFRLHKIGFVFQAYNLLPVLTALENVEYVLLLQGLSKREREERSRAILEEMGLGELSHRFPRELSGGQQQRVAVARALISRPAVVLADEPTANLDGENTARLLDIMEEMCEKRKTTFLFSTHDERVVRRAHRVILLEDGKIKKNN